MAKTYQLTRIRRFVNTIMARLTKLGYAPQTYAILTVPGRKSGKRYSTPISLIIESDKRYIVSPYGEVSWVKNARAAGEVTLTRGKTSETLTFTEVDPENAAPILQTYYDQEPITQPYFDVTGDSSLEDFAQEAPKHPVFLLHDEI